MTAPRPDAASTSAPAIVSFVALLVAVAAAGASQGVYAYRLAAVSAAPCVKRAMGVAPFEGTLWVVLLAASCVALVAAVVALATAKRGSGPGRPVASFMVVGALVMVLLSVAFHRETFDSSDSTLPTCGASSQAAVR